MFPQCPEREKETFFSQLPKRVKVAGTQYKQKMIPKKYATQYKYIQPHHPSYQSYIVLDCDGDTYKEIADTCLLPNLVVLNSPNTLTGREQSIVKLYNQNFRSPLIVSEYKKIQETPINNRGHIFFKLETPVPKIANRKTHNLLKLTIDSLTEALNCDHQYVGRLTKNPFYDNTSFDNRFRVSSFTSMCYSLQDLLDAVPSKIIDKVRKRNVNWGNLKYTTINSRNCILFDLVRQLAYREKRWGTTREQLFTKCQQWCSQYNNIFEIPLPQQECDTICRSITKWTWENYIPNHNSKIRGVAMIDSSLPLHEKQSKAADYTNKTRSERTKNKIKDMIDSFLENNRRWPSASEISKHCPCALNTAKKYLTILQE